MNLSDFPQFWTTLRKFKEIRDNNLPYYEKFMFGMGGLLGILALIISIEGAGLVSHDMIQNGRFGFARIRASLTVFLVFLALFVLILSLFTIALTSKRSLPIMCPLLYAVLIFFFGAIPMMAEGNSILSFAKVENHTIDTMCQLNPRDLSENTNKYTYSLFQWAHKFDDVSQYMLDQYMCTKTCPCHDFKKSKPHIEFDWLPEYVLNPHGRTNINKEGYEPLLWVPEDAPLGFASFMDCYQYYEELAEKDELIDLKEIFKIPEQVFGRKYGRAFSGPDRGDRYRRGKPDNDGRMRRDPSTLFLARHMDEMEAFQVLEDDFNCSGMCRQGIFYFENPTHMGPPAETCLKHLKQTLADTTRGFAVTSIITGVVCLFLFFFHFGLYFRPYPQSGEQQAPNMDSYPGPAAQGQPELVPNVSTTQIGDNIGELDGLEMNQMYKQNNADDYVDPYGSQLHQSRKSKRASKQEVVLDDNTDVDIEDKQP